MLKAPACEKRTLKSSEIILPHMLLPLLCTELEPIDIFSKEAVHLHGIASCQSIYRLAVVCRVIKIPRSTLGASVPE